MRWTYLRWVGLAALGALALGGCSSDSVKDATGGSPSTTGGGTGGLTAAGGTTTGGSGGSSGEDPSCTGEPLEAELPAIDLFVVLDASDSMFLSAGSSTRWGQLSSGLLGFFRDTASAGVGVDLALFPEPLEDVPDSCTSDEACGEGAPCFTKICLNVLGERDEYVSCESDTNCEYGTTTPPLCRTIGDCSTRPGSYCFTESPSSCDGGTCTQSGICSRFVSCRTEAYEEPAVARTELPAGYAELATAIQRHSPGEETTTAPALSAALARARAYAADHPDHEVVVVLATGGLPTACFAERATPEEAVTELATLAEAAAADGVKTHVIGVFSQLELDDGARELLDGVAEAGGTESAVIIDAVGGVSTQVNAALVSIRGLERGCEFRAPDTTDYDLVNVLLRSAASTSVIPRVASKDACDGERGGWYYDVDPETADPQRLSLCPTSCVELRLAQGGAVELELGCASHTLD